MARVAPLIPAESDILCEQCGYTLNGLSEDGRCPECGTPVLDSTSPARRRPAQWDEPARMGIVAFLSTTIQVIFRPTRFFRALATRQPLRQPLIFAWIHWSITSLLLGIVAWGHVDLHWQMSLWTSLRASPRLIVPFSLAALIVIAGTTELAARLTSWEAAYRGLRLPLNVVRRGLYYHAAHYLPVALLALLIVFGYRFIVAAGWLDPYLSAQRYLYTLAAAVILAAGYLFKTYWIGMRNMMFANR